MTRSLSVSRMRLIALLIVAAFSISTAVVATGYVASPASAAKKKKKKCKKGYKKVKGKCKKVKKKTVAVKVTAINLKLVTSNRGQVKVTGLIKTDVGSRSQLNGEVAVTVAGATQKVPAVFALSGSAITQFSKLVETSFADTDGGSVTVTVGGVTSAPETIK